jgi:hypothetical protein
MLYNNKHNTMLKETKTLLYSILSLMFLLTKKFNVFNGQNMIGFGKVQKRIIR